MRTTALETTLTRANLCLQAGYGLSLTDAAGVELTSSTGRVWLTMEGDTRDINLRRGDTYTIERDGLTLVTALEPSLVRVRIPHGRTVWHDWMERVWTFLARAAKIRARARLTRGYPYL
ncbi:MAG TPA: DUF2917 domain-containing protein [Burkholderiales bacterium]|nr:DUF2917 domain-containing protein [Burkholderiales bacterium]